MIYSCAILQHDFDEVRFDAPFVGQAIWSTQESFLRLTPEEAAKLAGLSFSFVVSCIGCGKVSIDENGRLDPNAVEQLKHLYDLYFEKANSQ